MKVGENMFTGIIEEIGTIKNMRQSLTSMQLSIAASKVLNDVKIGDSISVNGTCLTVTSYTQHQFEVDVMPETFQHTSLKQLSVGTSVNLERAMAANGRFGGHFVTGHIDGMGTIVSMKTVENAVYIKIQLPDSMSKFFIEKGSVAVDGTSLTVFGVEGNMITVSLIPQTRFDTILGHKKIGDLVNIECDMMAKYLYQFSKEKETTSSISTDYLRENGFL
jgi:riboflavin synthase